MDALGKRREPIEASPPDYRLWAFVIISFAIMSGAVVYISWASGEDAKENSVETNYIKNMNCDQLYSEEMKQINNYVVNNTSFHIVRDKFHSQCVSLTFKDSEPTEAQQDSYFLSLSCPSLQSYIADQKIYYEQAIVDYKVICKQ
uniref:ORF24 n=1 Tax=Nitrosopumilaceae spindle-shaped virus TaxID=3065433 RepID=A0AAT9J7K0_9VIRU